MPTLYGLKTCDTCRKAMQEMKVAKSEVEFVDVRANPLGPDEIARFLSRFGDDLVNRRSTTWRGLDEEERAAPVTDLLTRHPALMKRPVIDVAGKLYLGWNIDTRSAILG